MMFRFELLYTVMMNKNAWLNYLNPVNFTIPFFFILYFFGDNKRRYRVYYVMLIKIFVSSLEERYRN